MQIPAEPVAGIGSFAEFASAQVYLKNTEADDLCGIANRYTALKLKGKVECSIFF